MSGEPFPPRVDRPSFCKAWCVNDEKQRTGASFCSRIPSGNSRRGPLFASAGVYVGFRICARSGGRFWLFSPLGVALVAGVPKDGILAASLGASLGYLFSGVDGATPLRYIASVVVASVISFALRQVKKETLSQALSCVTAASCCLVTGLALGMSEGLMAALVALDGAESLLAGGAAYFFYRSFLSSASSAPCACLLPRVWLASYLPLRSCYLRLRALM